ncbi:hypothetical protein BJX63DRAFT_442865 [Aspergillus granulosus]|uniref:Capsule polysaccharide biosynthesis protein n=1 Tax=Aspergillus granulosus TaxID=176169 RepID=A0ABR4HDG6_9EURO
MPRTNAKILADLQAYKPNSGSERNVWAFWDNGFSNSPGWNQRNVKDDRPHVGQHSSDLIRLPLLYLYGGVWLDVEMFLFYGLDDLSWNELENPDTPYEVAACKVSMGPEILMLFNWYIAARKGSLCIKYWHEIFIAVWQGATSCEGRHRHPLLGYLPRYEPPSLNRKMLPFIYEQFADYLAQVFCLERLRHLTDSTTRLTDWNGHKHYELLNLSRSAEALVQGVLSMSSTMKVSHGLATAGREYLAEIWDKSENSDADSRPGTFAVFLREASETLKQTKELVPLKMPVVEKAVLRAGTTEVTELIGIRDSRTFGNTCNHVRRPGH